VNNRVSALWLPGLVVLSVSMGLLMVLIRAGLRPLTFCLDWHHPLQFYVPWLLTLPLFGALGAYWSLRAGGGTRRRLLAGVFPVVAMAASFVVLLPIEIIGDVVVGGRHFIWHSFCGFGSFMVSWVLFPGAALLLGALPFLKAQPGNSVRGL